MINAASRSAALNPPELTANQQVFESGEVVAFVSTFQDFCRTSAAVQYRFTRERSLVQAQPCPSRKALEILGFSRVWREFEVILGGGFVLPWTTSVDLTGCR